MPFGRPNSDIATFVIGTALCGSGFRGMLNPSKMAETFGVVNRTTETSTFFPSIGGRNVAAGVAVWAMTYTGQRKALGILLTSWMAAGFADIRLLLSQRERKSVWIHVMNTCILGVLGPYLLLNE